MSVTNVIELQNANATINPDLSQLAWYAAQTRSRHERQVGYYLASRGIVQYLPTFVETHIWSDRRKKIETPLFPGYVFLQIKPCNQDRAQVLRTPGVVRLVGSDLGGTPIPSEQIDSVRTLLEQKLPWTSYPFLKAGQRVRVRGGALDGMEGIFLKRNGEDTLVISVDAIQRSLSVSIQGYTLEVL
jgi:transcription antitermination factor NusG